ncbi:MAG: TetR/AcrR family transcriptional regulator [Anaerolineae bacterium]
MGKVEIKKELIIQCVVEYIVEKGLLNEMGIRSLAKAAGTSDRMLIYYFGTKDELINQALNTIAAGFTLQLDALLGDRLRPASQLLAELTAIVSHDDFDSSARLWFELVGLAARKKEPYASNAKALAENWIEWVESRLIEPQEGQAADLYAHLEGRLMLKLVRGE